tara:strand:+ start:1387 stop:2058 length:672 start_codon:yes stop_codon:yes gene_type:complete
MFTCEYCKRSFRRESTLAAHTCEKKRRWLCRDDKQVQLGFRSFQTFYKLATGATKDKSIREFCDSQYYGDFVKFGRYVDENKIDPADKYVEFLIRESVKLSDWYSDRVLELWIKRFLKSETVERGVERSILNMQDWAETNDGIWSDYFKNVSGNRFVHMVQTGKISPWVIYTCDSAQAIIDRLSDEQISRIAEFIDPEYWTHKTRHDRASVGWAEDLWKESGL